MPAGNGKRASAAVTSVALASLVASCIDEGRGSIFVSFGPDPKATFVEDEDGLRLRLEVEALIDTDGEVLLDSALVVVNHDDQVSAESDPDIETEGFPVDGSGEAWITLEFPSPITDVTSFDAFCSANGRSADVTLRFFTTSIDPDPDVPPPVTEFSVNVPIRLAGAPTPPNVIGSSGVASVGTSGDPTVASVVAGPADDLLFVVRQNGISPLKVYRAGVDSQDGFLLPELAGSPRVASDGPAGLFLAGVGSVGGLLFLRRSGDVDESFTIDRGTTDPEYESFNVVALEPTASGVRAAVISSFSLVHPIIVDPESVKPPADKYYGSFIVEAALVDGGFVPTAIVQVEREIVGWVALADGTLQITSELPPRSSDTTLRVERLDATGAVVWSHDEPVSAHDVDADTLPDGTVLLAYEVGSGFIEVLRLDGSDGSVLDRASFVGDHPTVAAYGAEGTLLSFNGRADQEGVVAPARSVPLLLELGASLEVLRGTQIACSGRADLQRAGDGSPMLVGAFGERFTLGDANTGITSDALVLTKIADPR